MTKSQHRKKTSHGPKSGGAGGCSHWAPGSWALAPWRGGPSGALEMARLDEAHARVNAWRQRALVVLLVQERSRKVARVFPVTTDGGTTTGGRARAKGTDSRRWEADPARQGLGGGERCRKQQKQQAKRLHGLGGATGQRGVERRSMQRRCSGWHPWRWSIWEREGLVRGQAEEEDGRRRQGAGLRVNGGDEADEVAVGGHGACARPEELGARAREAGRSSWWCLF